MTLNVAGIKTIRAKTFDQRRDFEFISKDQIRHHRSAGGRGIQERTADGLICKRPAGNTYKIQDDAWALDFYYAHKDDTAAQLVNAVLTNTQMWDQDLTKIEGLEAAVLADLELIRTEGAEAAYKSCL